MLVNPLFFNQQFFPAEFNERIYQQVAKPKLLKKVESDEVIQFQIHKLDGDFTNFEFKLVKLNEYQGVLTVFSVEDNFKVSIKLNLSKVDINNINFEISEISDQILNLNIPKYLEVDPADVLNNYLSAFLNPLLGQNVGGCHSNYERGLRQQERQIKEQEKVRKQQEKVRKEQERKQREYEERIRKEQERRQKEYEQFVKREQERRQREYEEEVRKEEARRERVRKEQERRQREERKQQEKEARLQKIREEKLRKQAEAGSSNREQTSSEQEKIQDFVNQMFGGFFPFQNPQFYSNLQHPRPEASSDRQPEPQPVPKAHPQKTYKQYQYSYPPKPVSSKVPKASEPVPDPDVSEPIAEVITKSPTPQPEVETPPSSGRSTPLNHDSMDLDDTHSINSDDELPPASPSSSLHKAPSIEEVEDEEFVMLRKKFGQ